VKLVFRTGDYSDFLVRSSILEAAGLHVHSDNAQSYSAMPELGLTDGYRLWVLDDDFDEAYEILKGEPFKPELPEIEEDKIHSCTACGSSSVVRYRSIVWLPVMWALGLLLAAPGGNMRKCQDCGHSYKTKGPALTRPLKIYFAYQLLLIALIFGAGYIWLPDFILPEFNH
jgi:transcription elongation factor Elf1